MQRDSDSSTIPFGDPGGSDGAQHNVPKAPAALDGLRALVEKARSGDESALPEIREHLDIHPELWEHYGDLAAHASRAWVETIAGNNIHFREAILKKAASMRDELQGENPLPIERLLVHRVVVTWLQLHFFETAAAKPGQIPLKQAEFIERRLNFVQRRYLQAMKSLVDTRRLLAVKPTGRHATDRERVDGRKQARQTTIKLR